MKNILLFSIALFICLGFTVDDFNYLPATVGSNQVLKYTQFTLSYNEEHEQADWVAYELTDAEVAASQPRCNCFTTDKDVTTGSATKKDYTSTGFDKGHLSPAADNNMSEKANRESFLMSNMSPQLPQFNRNIWAKLEDWVRHKATEYKKIYVVTGPVFVNNLGTISNKKITIPGYYYKTILRFDGDKVKTIAFLLPHVGAVGELKDYVVPVNTIETLTGIDFYPELSSSIENKVESQLETKKWGF
ncbi:MAG: DNA/RNA endonuclease [Flavobacteriales bacterium]|nr:MAG: DNA/RNA endonuclease [Flavobacteriales bacterium]